MALGNGAGEVIELYRCGERAADRAGLGRFVAVAMTEIEDAIGDHRRCAIGINIAEPYSDIHRGRARRGANDLLRDLFRGPVIQYVVWPNRPNRNRGHV